MTSSTSRAPRFAISPTLAICTIAGLVAVVGLFLPSLSPVQTSSDTPYSVAVADGGQIEIVDFGFAGDFTVSPGAVITVVNNDSAPHTITANDGSFDTGVIGGGETGSFVVPDVDGVISFVCTIHPSMTGQLTVQS